MWMWHDVCIRNNMWIWDMWTWHDVWVWDMWIWHDVWIWDNTGI